MSIKLINVIIFYQIVWFYQLIPLIIDNFISSFGFSIINKRDNFVKSIINTPFKL